MKKTFASLLFFFASAVILFSICSCSGEKNTAPNIAFVVAGSFVYEDTALVHGTIFNVGIVCSKTGTEGLLNSCKISRSINGGADSTIQQMNFITQHFAQYFSYPASDSGNTERYTFTVTKIDGLSSSVSVKVSDI